MHAKHVNTGMLVPIQNCSQIKLISKYLLFPIIKITVNDKYSKQYYPKLTPTFIYHANLLKLDMSDNTWTLQKDTLNAILNNALLISLDLGSNYIKITEIQVILQIIGTLKHLKSFNLRNNNLAQSGATQIANALKSNYIIENFSNQIM